MTATITDPTGRAEAPAEAPTLRHMPALDGLRGVAVAGVLLFHAGHLTGGYLGVDLFFVLSGFLITSLLLREASDRSSVDLRRFWVRRARRLLPAMGGVLLGVAVYAWLLAEPTELERIRLDALATIAYVANWRFVVADQGYWDLFVAPSPLQHMWSVAIEEQFYLLWPLLFVGVLRWRGRSQIARTLLVVAPALTLASAVLQAVLFESAGRDRVYFGTDTRAASILVGVTLAAWLVHRGPARSVRAGAAFESAGLAGALVLGWAWVTVDGQSPLLYRGGLVFLAVCGAAVIAAAAAPRPGPLSRVLSLAPLRWLGLISYGVYLWHWPVYLVLDATRTGVDGWALVAIRVVATIAISAVSYVVVEQPVRHGRVPSAPLRVLAPLTAVAVVGALVAATSGAEDPAPTELASVPPIEEEATRREAAPETEHVLVVGNSVAHFLGEAMERMSVDPPDDLPLPPVDPVDPPIMGYDRAVVACSFPHPEAVKLGDGTLWENNDCTGSWEEDVDRLRPDTVVIAFSDWSDTEHRHGGEWLHPCDPEWDRRYREALSDAVRLFSRHGAEVVIVNTPYNDVPLASEERLPRTDCQNAISAEVAAAFPQARLVDLMSFFCDGPGSCRQEVDGVELRTDGMHYVGDAALIITQWVLDEIREGDG